MSETAAQYLFAVLDDIDTVSDIAKSDDKLYRELVEKLHRKRFNCGTTDGYTVVMRAEPQTAPELTATCQKLLPGGIIDDATYAEIEDALDRADAPATVGGRWLKLHERIAALTAERPAASAEPQSQADSSPQTAPIPAECETRFITDGDRAYADGLLEDLRGDGLSRDEAAQWFCKARVENARRRSQAEIAKRPTEFLAWARETFGSIALARGERLMRFAEEAIELAHAGGMERSTLDAITDRVYSREPGTIKKEIGQAQACLEMYAENVGESADALAEIEWQRVQSIPQEEWDRRHAAKQALGIALTRPVCTCGGDPDQPGDTDFARAITRRIICQTLK
jgi:hypothetical protein